MARGRKPAPGEPSRGSAISRAFRERKANELNELNSQVEFLKAENQRLMEAESRCKNENFLLRQLISNNRNDDLTSFSPDSDGAQANTDNDRDDIRKRKRETDEDALNREGRKKPLSFCSTCGCPSDREIEIRLKNLASINVDLLSPVASGSNVRLEANSCDESNRSRRRNHSQGSIIKTETSSPINIRDSDLHSLPRTHSNGSISAPNPNLISNQNSQLSARAAPSTSSSSSSSCCPPKTSSNACSSSNQSNVASSNSRCCPPPSDPRPQMMSSPRNNEIESFNRHGQNYPPPPPRPMEPRNSYCSNPGQSPPCFNPLSNRRDERSSHSHSHSPLPIPTSSSIPYSASNSPRESFNSPLPFQSPYSTHSKPMEVSSPYQDSNGILHHPPQPEPRPETHQPSLNPNTNQGFPGSFASGSKAELTKAAGEASRVMEDLGSNKGELDPNKCCYGLFDCEAVPESEIETEPQPQEG